MNDPPHTRPGAVICGRYRIERVLGEGGIGIVAEATALDGSRVAIKFLRPAFVSDAEWVARFAREARAAASIRGKHVASVLDVGEVAPGNPFIVMELLQGSDLEALLARRGPLPIGEAVGYVLQACEALGEAHARGIVHRDLKPANLFLHSGVIKVLDFGISKMQDDAQKLTRTSATMGSILYMAPEQLKSSTNIDHRADVYSIGATLYELLAQRTPFVGETSALLCVAILTTAPTPLRELRPEVPARLAEIIHRALEPNPDERYPSIAAFANDIRSFSVEVDGLAQTDLAPSQAVGPPPAVSMRDATLAPMTRPANGKRSQAWIIGPIAFAVAGIATAATVALIPSKALTARGDDVADSAAGSNSVLPVDSARPIVEPARSEAHTEPSSATPTAPSSSTSSKPPPITRSPPPYAGLKRPPPPVTAAPLKTVDPFGGGRK